MFLVGIDVEVEKGWSPLCTDEADIEVKALELIGVASRVMVDVDAFVDLGLVVAESDSNALAF